MVRTISQEMFRFPQALKLIPLLLIVFSPLILTAASSAFTDCEYYQHDCPDAPTTYPYENGNLIVIEGRVAPASTQPNDAFAYTRGSSEPGRPRPRQNNGRGRQEQASFRGDSSIRLADDGCNPTRIQRECVHAQVFRSGPASRPAFLLRAETATILGAFRRTCAMDGIAPELDPMPPADDLHDESPDTMPDESPADIVPQRVVEAILFATDSPLTAAKIASLLDVGDARDVKKHIAALNEQYAAAGLSFRIEQIAGGYQFMTQPQYNTWLARLLRARDETRLSPASLETLAIVAYKQPVTRADIEAIRGVAAGDMLNRLRELNLGRPLLYGTTRHFLEVFGLGSLEDLPQVEALRPVTPPTTPAPTADASPPVQLRLAEEAVSEEPDSGDAPQ
jgi:segregation and condensation protein B